jgi:hypothetical protein
MVGDPRTTPIPSLEAVFEVTVPDRDMVHGEAPLRYYFLQIPVAERIPQIPADTQYDDSQLGRIVRSTCNGFRAGGSRYEEVRP